MSASGRDKGQESRRVMEQQEQAMRQRAGRWVRRCSQAAAGLGEARKDGVADGGMGLVLGPENSDTVTQEEEQVDVVVVVLGAGNEWALATRGGRGLRGWWWQSNGAGAAGGLTPGWWR